MIFQVFTQDFKFFSASIFPPGNHPWGDYLQLMKITIYSKITVKHAKHITHEKNKGGTHCQY